MFVKLYLIALPIFLAIDAIWLGVVSKDFYKNQIGNLMKQDINWTAAVVFYIIYIFGLVFFVIAPSVEKNSSLRALFTGAIFGLITYATYDLTNLATLNNWSYIVTIVDLAWGTFLSATVSYFTYIINKF